MLSPAGLSIPAAMTCSSARADSPVPVSEPVRVLVPVIAPANTQAATKTSQRAMVVRGRRADAAAARRTLRASAPSGEVGMEFMPAPSQRPAPPSVGRSTVRAPPAPGRDGGLTRRAQR